MTVPEELQEGIVKPQLYAHLLFSSDSTNDVYKSLSQRAAEFGNLMTRELLFFDLEIMAIPENSFATLAAAPQLATYRHYLESIRKFQPYTLPEREERLLKQKSLIGAEAFSRLFDELSASFSFTLTIDGKDEEFTGEELLWISSSPRCSPEGTRLQHFSETARGTRHRVFRCFQ